MNNKIYIGYTGKSVGQRFHKHCTNALSGVDSYLYRAMRKYGADKFSYRILLEIESKSEAMMQEIEKIKQYDSTNQTIGYNIGKGGSGGWIMGQKSKEEYEKWIIIITEKSTGSNNPNHSGLSDEKIIDAGVKYFSALGYIGGSRVWALHAKKIGIPQTFSKNRFGGIYDNFANIIKERTGLEIRKHFKTETHREKLKKHFSNRIWVNNGIRNSQIKKEELEKYITAGFKKGRTCLK